RREEDARLLAQTMVALGTEYGVRTTALLTRMDVPLGRAVGNAVEVEEAVATLAGYGPSDLVEVVLALARQMLRLAGRDGDPEAALANGQALARYRDMIAAQGGDPDAPLAVARHIRTVPAPAAGWLRRLDARAVGNAAWRLGAGRARKEDPVSAAAGGAGPAKAGGWGRAGGRCWSCAPTTNPGSARRCPPSAARSRSAPGAPPCRPWSSTR